MKSITLLLVFLTVSLNVYASDVMQDEIVCNSVHISGSADSGLTVALKANATSWVKILEITENGYIGPRVIANLQVPLQPEQVLVQHGRLPIVALVYKNAQAVLSVYAVYHGPDDLRLTGTGLIQLNLEGYEPEAVPLNCEYAE